MRLEYMREFEELVKSLNFLEASKRMCISQPALSNHIKAMENDLGVTLFDRRKGTQPQLTIAGKTFLNGSGKILAQYDSLVLECQRVARAEECKLTITLPFFIRESSQILMNEISCFKGKHPELEVVLIQGSFDSNPLDGVLLNEIDCCLSFFYKENTLSDSLQSVPLLSEEVFLWVDDNCPLSTLDAIPLEALEGYDLVSAASEKARIVDEWLDGFFEDILPINHISYYAESFDDFILNAGIEREVAILPASYQSYPTFQLRQNRMMLPFDPPLFVNIGVCFRKNDRNRAATEFKEYLLNSENS